MSVVSVVSVVSEVSWPAHSLATMSTMFSHCQRLLWVRNVSFGKEKKIDKMSKKIWGKKDQKMGQKCVLKPEKCPKI